jgi:hypothetical protein
MLGADAVLAKGGDAVDADQIKMPASRFDGQILA